VKYLFLPLRLFQAHGVPGAPTCRYHPSCSQYAADALRKYGPVRGSLKAGWRFLRCNPWSHGGVDYA
jgi:putative membrane protein insertion efficiency factor